MMDIDAAACKKAGISPRDILITMQGYFGGLYASNFNSFGKVMVAPASGYTSGQALQAIAEVAKENLPTGFGYELGGMAREEAETSGGTTAIIFVLCFVFVYLLLSAQYESYILPLAVLLSVPAGLLGSFLFVNGFSALGSIPALKMDDNWYNVKRHLYADCSYHAYGIVG